MNSFEQFTKKSLLEVARKNNIKGRSGNKTELINSICSSGFKQQCYTDLEEMENLIKKSSNSKVKQKKSKLNYREIAWKKYFEEWQIDSHNFVREPFKFTSEKFKKSKCFKDFDKTCQKETRLLCYITNKDELPKCFSEKNLFLLPIKNGEYIIIRGNGFVDIPTIESKSIKFNNTIGFDLETSTIGNSESQHIDYIYSTGLLEHMIGEQLYPTMRGRKYSPKFSFTFNKCDVIVNSIQYETDSVYEGKNNIIIIEAKNSKTKNTAIRQLYYPYRCIKNETKTIKNVTCLFFEKRDNLYNFWFFDFKDENDFNSIELKKSIRYFIQ